MKTLVLFFFAIALVRSDFLSFPAIYESLVTDNINITQQLFDGFWQEANVTAPSNLAQKCFNETEAALFVSTVNLTLSYLANDNLVQAINVINQCAQELPDEVKVCVNASPKTQEVYDAYGISNYTLTQLESKVGGYVLTHFLQVRQKLIITNSDFQSGKYEMTGVDGGIFLKIAMGNDLGIEENPWILFN